MAGFIRFLAGLVKKPVHVLKKHCKTLDVKPLLPRSYIISFFASLLAAAPLKAGYEIADLTEAYTNQFKGYTDVWIDYGANRITDEEWVSFEPPTGYVKNTPRNGEFNQENTFSSPGMSAGNVLEDEIGGYSWKFIARIQSAMWPYDRDVFPETLNAYQAAFATTTPPAGSIKFSSNEKNQEMVFWARENNSTDEGAQKILRFFVTDQWGNKYIMGASGAATDAEIPALFDTVVLPEGWTKSTGYLDETISLLPAYGAGNQAHYNLFRESGDNTFFQFEWGDQTLDIEERSGITIANQIEDMPIWGGALSDKILGRAGDDNLIHGAEGDDFIFVLGQNDTIFGDDGTDTVVFEGREYAEFSLLSYGEGGAELVLEDISLGYQKTLYNVEFLRFDDLTISTAAIPEPSTIPMLAGAIGLVGLVRVLRRQKKHATFA